MMMQWTRSIVEAVWLISFKTVYKPMNWTCTICSECCSSANFQNSTVRTHYRSAHQPSLAVRPRTHLHTVSHDVSVHPWHLSILPTVMFHPCCRWHPDDSCSLLPHIVCTFRLFVYVQSASRHFRFLVPPPGMTCLSTSHLRRHSRFSRPFCFPVPTRTLSYDSC